MGRRGKGLRRRSAFVLLMACAAALWLVWRVVDIQVVQAAWLTEMARGEHMASIAIPAPRGLIVDRRGRVLAMNEPAYMVTASPRVIQATARQSGNAGLVGEEAARLAAVLPYTRTQIAEALSGQSWYRLIDPDVSPARAKVLLAQQNQLPGITLVPIERRVYPDGALAAQVLGFVGANGNGLAGVEYADNRILAGRPGQWTVATDINGNPLPAWTQVARPPVAGDTVELTIDAAIQYEAERLLARDVRKFHARNGTVIIMRPATGAILALANYPTFNPNRYAAFNPSTYTDWAITDPIPPGSIFKPVTASAGLQDGVVTPTTEFDTVGYQIVDGVRIDDWMPHGWGWISFTRGLELSSDQVFMDVGLKLGAARLYRMIRAFGFFHPSGVGLPGDSAGIFIPLSQVNAVDLATIAFGQGIAVTPLQEATMINAVANGGTLFKPRIRRAILAPDGRVLKRFGPVVEGHPITRTVAHDLHVMMEREVGYGTGIPAQVPGYTWAGKTGTAQQIVDGRTSSTVYVSSYAGYGPMPHPRFSMVVMINDPKGAIYGAEVAAPMWSAMARWLMHYWHIPPDLHNHLPNGVAQGNAVPPL